MKKVYTAKDIEELKRNGGTIPADAILTPQAKEILAAADVSGGAVPKGIIWTDKDGVMYSVQRINDVIKCGLDELCEKTDAFFEKYYGTKKSRAIRRTPCISRARACRKSAAWRNIRNVVFAALRGRFVPKYLITINPVIHPAYPR